MSDPTPSPSGSTDKRLSKSKPSRNSWLGAITLGVVLLALGTAIGYFFALRGGGTAEVASEPAATPAVWTCSMHPQFKLPKPGKCPICFMDLIPLEEDTGKELGPRQLRLSPTAARLAEIQTSPVVRQYATNIVRMVGKVEYDETKVVDITAWVPGRLDRLYVDYTGITVRKGDHLVLMYSPELIVAQRELIQAMKSADRLGGLDSDLSMSTLQSTEKKLRLLGLLPEQIDQIKQRGEPTDQLTVYAPSGGIVIDKWANEGMYVQTGTKIYTIADLSVVWVYLEAYESDLPWLRYGQEVEFTTEAYPGTAFHGRVAFIDPVLDERTRTVKVRVTVPNPDQKLKPGMFVRASVRSRLDADGRVFDASLVGKWISPMHPEVVKDGPGKCDVCGIDLVPAESLGYAVPKEAPEVPLLIPATAPMITGKRAVVYVQLPDREQPTFEGREILLGPRAGDAYIVRQGLREGDRVVMQGNFKIDSALQIRAKPSMMSPEGEASVTDDQRGDAVPPAGGTARITIPAAFRPKLTPLYDGYLHAAAMLAEDNLAAAKQSLASVAREAKEADVESLDEQAQAVWRQQSDRLIMAAIEASEATTRDAVRRRFGPLSQEVIQLVITFGHALDGPLYRIHCPMALGAKGADWLQRTKEVDNPYYGPAMLRCGSLAATYESQAPLTVPDAFRKHLARVYDAYLELQSALADDRLDDARRGFAALRRALADTNAGMLPERTLTAWQAALSRMKPAFEGNPQSADLADLRTRFEPIADTMLAVAESFGHTRSDVLHKAFCPMAFDNRGAAWLQADDVIANPYFGHQMLRCGKIQQDFPPVGATDGRVPAKEVGHDD